MVHKLAQAYGQAPHSVLEWTPFELSFNLACYDSGQRDVAYRVKRITSTGGMVFPAVLVGG